MPLIKALLASALGALVVPPGGASPAAPDAARGGQLFLQCRACHTVDAGAANTVGPNLSGIVGMKAASRTGYVYSPALTASGLMWSTANLDAFLKRPNQLVPGTKMTFGGIVDAKSRADIVAYLTTLKSRK